jgi:group I intron endonuclease
MFIIYQIKNIINGKSYVGFTSVSKEGRWRDHRKRANRGDLGYFYCAIRKYGAENFRLEILEEGWGPEIGKNIREPYWISVLMPEYNMTAGGEGCLGFKHSDEYKRVLSDSMKGSSISEKTRLAVSVGMRGNKNAAGSIRLHSPETRKRISVANIGKKATPEARKKMSIKAIERELKRKVDRRLDESLQVQAQKLSDVQTKQDGICAMLDRQRVG